MLAFLRLFLTPQAAAGFRSPAVPAAPLSARLRSPTMSRIVGFGLAVCVLAVAVAMFIADRPEPRSIHRAKILGEPSHRPVPVSAPV